MITATAWAIYLLGFIVSARIMFSRLRPARVPLCGNKQHGALKPDNHYKECYRRQRSDLNVWKIDSDIQAFWCAAGASLCWFFLLIYLAVTVHPRELSAEKDARIKKMRKRIEELEAQL